MTPPKKQDRPEYTGARVLLVDDSDLIRDIAVALLEDLGVAVTVAEDGAEALEALEKARLVSDGRPFDIILMDVQMPVLDGLAATRAIRASRHPELVRIPVVAMTGNTAAKDRAAFAEAGMDDQLPKPFGLKNLIELLDRWLVAPEIGGGSSLS